MVSSIEVAKRAGVSQSTVSRVFRNLDGIRPDTKERVLKAARELSYRPNEAARNLVTGRMNQIAVIVQNLLDPSYSEFVDAVGLELRRRDIRMVLFEADEPDGSLSPQAMQALNAADGVIIASPRLDCRNVSNWLPLGKPHIFAYRRPREVEAPFISPDHEAGIELVVAHLDALGHRHFALIAVDPTVYAGAARAEAFAAVMRRRGFHDSADNVYLGTGQYEDAYNITSRLLSETSADSRPTALICPSDIAAFGVLGAAADLGVRVPHDLSVTGFDDLQMASWANFRLTTVAMSSASIAQESVSQLLELMETGAVATASEVRVPVNLRVRHTTGASPRKS